MSPLNALGFPSYSITGTPSGGAEATITINSNSPDAFGSYYTLDGDLTGWDSPDMRMTMLTKIGSDVDAEGEIPADLHYRGRSIQLEVIAECTSEVNREASKLLLAQACNTSACVFTAFEGWPTESGRGTKFCNVVRGGNTSQGKLAMTDLGWTTKASATNPDDGYWGLPPGTPVYPFKAVIELYAADPFKYQSVLETVDFVDGVATFDNLGTYPTMNAFINLVPIGGELIGGLTIDTGERTLALLIPTVPASAPPLSGFPENLYLDFYNKLIYDGYDGPPPDGANYYYLRNMQTPWLRIPTGDGTVTLNHPLDGTVNFYPAYL